jgi:DEAD/DEAH box helicase domain-containing protein
VLDSLAGLGLDGLYRHQAQAFHAAERGEHIVVSTGTASGKTLAFNLPVLNALAEEPKLRALYLYPTKALAQDQARALAAFRLPRLRPAIYDGDTRPSGAGRSASGRTSSSRTRTCSTSEFCPHHDRWGDVLQNLRYCRRDEAHVYRGVFGSHVANVLRRLRRAAAIYGSRAAVPPCRRRRSPTRASSSSPCSASRRPVIGRTRRRTQLAPVAFWNPPLLDEELQLRASALGEGAKLLADLVERGLRTICFAKSGRRRS